MNQPMRVENKRTYDGPGIYVGRPTVWGNPFTHISTPNRAEHIVSSREESIARYREYALRRLESDPRWLDPLMDAEALVCWCAPLDCHADVLVRLIERAKRDRMAA